MPTYAYQAVDGAGKRMRGHAQAMSSGALTRTLEERGLLVLDVAESADSDGRRRGIRFGRRREVLEVTRAMAALLPGRHAARAGAQRGVGSRVGRRSRRAPGSARARRAWRDAVVGARRPSANSSRRSTSDSSAPAKRAAISTPRSLVSPISSSATSSCAAK